jgi:hypothetical protein
MARYQAYCAILLSCFLIIRLCGAALALCDVIAAPDPLPVEEWNTRGDVKGEVVLEGKVLFDEVVYKRTVMERRSLRWFSSEVDVEVPFVGKDWKPGDPVRAVCIAALPLDRAAVWHRELSRLPVREADVLVGPLGDEPFRALFPRLQKARDPVWLSLPVWNSSPYSGPYWTDWAFIAVLGALLVIGVWLRRPLHTPQTNIQACGEVSG